MFIVLVLSCMRGSTNVEVKGAQEAKTWFGYDGIPTCLSYSLHHSTLLVFAARCYESAAYVVMRCLSLCVCLSITFVSCVKMSNRIFKIFSPSGSQAILVLPHQTAWQYSDGNSPNGDVECRWGWLKSRFSMNTWLRDR